jgi:hypothetical protein
VNFFADVGLGEPVLSPLVFTTSKKEAPEAASFWIAVSSRGDVRHCFLKNSSGDSALDEQARRYLLLARFPALEKPKSKIKNDQVWATATIEWGNDIASQTDSAEPRQP